MSKPLWFTLYNSEKDDWTKIIRYTVLKYSEKEILKYAERLLRFYPIISIYCITTKKKIGTIKRKSLKT